MEAGEGLDGLLQPLGGFGRFQKLNLVFICSLSMLCAISELTYVFTAGNLKHRCFFPECGESIEGSYDQLWLSDTIPKTSKGEFESCLRFNSSGSGCKDVFRNATSQCSSFIYDTKEWTIVREDWGINCNDNKWMLTLLGSVNNAGQVVGGLFMGFLADKFGRKKVLVTLSVLVSVIGTIKSFSVNYIMMIIIEFVESILVVSLFNGSFVLALEIVKPSKRVVAATIVSVAYPAGEILLATVQWLTLQWRTTLRILYPPFFLTIAFFWLMPESVRWLLNNKRTEEAVAVMKRLAKMNGKVVPHDIRERMDKIREYDVSYNEVDGRDKKAAFLALIRSNRMRARFFACFFLWIANTFVYFGMTLNSVNINDDKFLNFILTAVMEIPSYTAAIFLLDRFGRRLSLTTSFIGCGVACFLFAFVPEDDAWGWAKVVLFLLGRLGSASSYIVIGVYTTEMFPTSLRSSIMLWMLTAGKLASILAPQTPLLSDIYKPLPLLVFSCLATSAGFLALIFPETLHAKLPDTIEEAEALGRKQSIMTNSEIPT